MSSGFITETEAADIRKRRQEEWERVRKADDPIERPEEPYDGRSLYDRLQEQKQKKDLEYEEAHKLKNMIKGLDDDEIEFLDLVDRTKLEVDRKKELEEEIELKDYRNRVAVLQEKSMDERLQAEKLASSKLASKTNAKNSQQKLLKGVVVRKSESRKRSLGESDDGNEEESGSAAGKQSKYDEGPTTVTADITQSAMRCVAILPGLGHYEDSSDNSSDSEVESGPMKLDLLGRKIEHKAAES